MHCISRDSSRICYKSKHNENIKFYSKRPLVNVCYPCVVQFHNEPPRRITYSEIHVQNINYLPTIQYSIRDCKIRQIIALVANRDSRYCGSAIGSRRTAICGINNLIIRNTEFTIRSVVPFVCFVFNMSIWFSYYCRMGQRSSGEFSPNESRASVPRIRLILIKRWVLGLDLFKLPVFICRWIKHVCTFQYREHPCYTRDLANHSLLSKRLHRTVVRRLYCAAVTMFIEYFISLYLLSSYLSNDKSTAMRISNHHIFIRDAYFQSLSRSIFYCHGNVFIGQTTYMSTFFVLNIIVILISLYLDILVRIWSWV